MTTRVRIGFSSSSGQPIQFYVELERDEARMRIQCGTKVHAEELAQKFVLFFSDEE